jgi:hypothetical protein
MSDRDTYTLAGLIAVNFLAIGHRLDLAGVLAPILSQSLR